MRTIFFCTGARNQDLLPCFDGDAVQFEYDERMASFKALGLAKATLTPSIICTTSGTAVAEVVPAMLEAYYSNTPLILITGDRPKKMHGSGAPQTIEHEGLTVTCRRSFVELTLEEFRSFDYRSLKYPAHINVLVDDTRPHDLPTVRHIDRGAFATFSQKVNRPLILISHEEKSMRPLVEKLVQKGFPFYAETMSGAHDLSPITSEKEVLSLFKTKAFDSVIRIGHTPLSKLWRLLESQHLPVFSFDSRGLPGLSYGEILTLGSEELLNDEMFWSSLKSFPLPSKSDRPQDALLKKFPHSEMCWVRRIQDLLPENSLIYLGNSLVVRFFELVQQKPFRVHGSRGVNGIDGQLATAIGLAQGTSETVYCILGDMTTFYDLSSIREMPSNLKLIIINNGGGRIFDMLKLDPRIIMPHTHVFKSIVEGMGKSYAYNDLEALKAKDVIELTPHHQETQEFLREWNT